MSFALVTAPQATLIAALVAAIAALVSLMVTVTSKRGEEFRIAQRNVIADDLKAVGKAVHEVIALTNIQLKVISSPQHAERYKEAAQAAKRLKAMRMDVRYTLWGLDEGFRELSRLPDWLGHAKPAPEVAERIFARGKALGRQIDLAVRDAYSAGKSPSWWRTYRVNSAAKHLRRVYREFSSTRTRT